MVKKLKRMNKKMLSLVLVFLIILNIVPFSATAEGDSKTERYTVLVLDRSSSMGAKPMGEMKKAAKQFVSQVMGAEGSNYVAIVAYSSSESVLCGFSSDVNTLHLAVDQLGYSGSGYTNMYSGLNRASIMLSNVPENSTKNIVLSTDGMPNRGISTTAGPYTSSDNYCYAYANSIFNLSDQIKSDHYIYTLGFFHNLGAYDKLFADRFLDDIQNAGYYDVDNGDDLDFVFGDIATAITKKTGTFKYPGTGQDRSATYYYDDTYFTKSSYLYNEHLATMSLSLGLSAWGSEDVSDYKNKSANAKKLLNEIGFQDFQYNNGFEIKPTKDSIGAVVANKKIRTGGKEYTLIALAVRGGGYESEWASNFTIGSSGFHEGFSEARNQVISFLNEYVSDKKISGDIKLWITGYSRAGATANMVAGVLNSGAYAINGCSLEPSNMYAYTFETPAGALKAIVDNKSLHGNIFNIINPNDFVPKVAPLTWGFGRYGLDRYLPTAEAQPETEYSKNLNNMLETYYSLEGTTPYIIDDFVRKAINIDVVSILPGGKPFISIEDAQGTQNEFLNDFIQRLAKDFLVNRKNYVEKYQSGIRDICGIMYLEPSKSDAVVEKLGEKLIYNLPSIALCLINTNYVKLYDVIAKCLSNTLLELDITEADLKEAIEALLSLVIAVGITNLNQAITLFENYKGIAQSHFPDVCLAWMQSMDTYYTSGGAIGFSSASYRIIRINCPVDVKVYNSDNTLVAEIKNDIPTKGLSTISAIINEDGEKLIFLPVEASYSVELIATDNGAMTYSVNEYSAEVSEINRLINFNDVPLSKGQIFYSNIPAYTTNEIENGTVLGSATAYDLSTNKIKIDVTEDLSGEGATTSYFMISAESENTEYGIVTGGGIRQKGSYVKLNALPYEGCTFRGWFSNDSLISQEPEYRFRVEKDIELIAKFDHTQQADKDVLNLAIEIATIIEADIDDYVDNSAKTEFIKTLKEAREIMEDKAVSQEKTDDIYERLVDSLLELRLKINKTGLTSFRNNELF